MKPHPTRTPQTPDARRRAAMADENRRMSDAAQRAAERARRKGNVLPDDACPHDGSIMIPYLACYVCGEQLFKAADLRAARVEEMPVPSPRKPLVTLPLEDEHIDPELACLLVAAMLERRGRAQEAAILKLELGEMLIRAALHKADHPGDIALAKAMREALGTNRGVRRGVQGKKPKGRAR